MALTKVSKELFNTDTVFAVDSIGGKYGSSSSPISIAVTVGTKTAAHPYNGDGSSNAYFLDGIEAPALQLNGADNVTSSITLKFLLPNKTAIYNLLDLKESNC